MATHQNPKVYIVIYSLYQHVYKLSIAIREGLIAKGVDAEIFQVQETLDNSVLEKMHAPDKPAVPIITPEQLVKADGILFGIPTRFGIFPAQLKALLDATGKIWANGGLAGKFVGTFFSTASQHGGQETTALNAVTYFAHHGMLYVPFGFASSAMFSNDEVIGGSAYGAGTITNGDGSRQPSETELSIATTQGQNFATLLTTYHKGLAAVHSAAAANGADADASTKSLKANTTNNGTSSDTPVITTTNPDGQTARPNDADDAAVSGAAATPGGVNGTMPETSGGPSSGSAAAVDAGAAAAGAGAGAAAAAAAGSKAAATSASGSKPAAASEATAAQPAAGKQQPKKKSRKFWFCCGSGDQLD